MPAALASAARKTPSAKSPPASGREGNEHAAGKGTVEPNRAGLSVAELVAMDQSDQDAPAVTPADLEVCPAFTKLTNSQRREFLDLASRHRFKAGETILEEGRETRCLWFILSGACEVVKTVPDGGDRVLATLEAGALFGEMSFFNPGPHSADVRAISDCTVLRMTAGNWAVLEQIGLRPAFHIARHTAAVMSDRLRRMDDWITKVLDETPDPAARAKRNDEWNDFRRKLFNG
ncbi:cAMP receptor protein [Alienimonas californiensis]|uniref:cAMP receptor protein n=2 Tax=Alienimonas californiensis TaxID=2527989 RepID=A0A517PFA3_9PLAN|nr:cAMP receptor protein [Alienimonas californiensis]